MGNSNCNDEANTADCNYDGGDCCININTDYCSECKCYHDQNCAAGFTPSVVGDGYCNYETNTANCNYDDGDCCLSTPGDGFCNDETNHAICNYNLGDCCGFNVNNDLCSDCSCLGDIFSILKPTSLCMKEV